jgi:glutaminase
MKLSVKTLKPRNPFVAAGLLRAAGAHRSSASAGRQRAARELQREIDRLRPSP